MTAYLSRVGGFHRRERRAVAATVGGMTTTDDTTYTVPGEGKPVPGEGKPAKKNKARRRAAKGLAWFALLLTAVLVLAEPWLLLPAAALLAAIALWD